MAPEMVSVRPRVIVVSRRSIRKNKFIDFVGEYHLDLLVRNGAAPIIVPRISGVDKILDGFEPIDGVLLCEGEDIDPSHYLSGPSALSADEADEVRRTHASDTTVDCSRDSIELRLARLCLARRIPLLGICRGSQVLNVAAGGTLYQDVAREIGGGVEHLDYDNYDGHRHGVSVVENSPLYSWFRDSLSEVEDGRRKIMVNSYHHQGVKKLAERFMAMGFADDGLVEGFYDPENYDPGNGKFLVGLQFHPERMRDPISENFDSPGCPLIYEEFVKAAAAYQRKAHWRRLLGSVALLDKFDQATNMARRLQSEKKRSIEENERLKQMGVTVRNGSDYLEKVRTDGLTGEADGESRRGRALI